jgi:hypothetical protein
VRLAQLVQVQLFLGDDLLQAGVELPLLLHRRPGALQYLDLLLRFLHVKALGVADGVQRLQLQVVAQQRHRLDVLLVQRLQQRHAQGAHLHRQLGRLLREDGEAVIRQRRIHACEDGRKIQPRGGRAHQHAGVDRRREQRQAALDAVDVLAVADLVQPVGDAVPDLEHAVVLRDAEVQHRQGHRGWRQLGAAFGQRRQVGQHVLQVDQRVA